MADGKISLRELYRRLRTAEDGRVFEETLGTFLYDDKSDQKVRWPTERIKPNPDRVDLTDPTAIEILSRYDWLCDMIKGGRHVIFDRVINNKHYEGPHIVEEGDSWHLHPLVTDIIDHLLETNVDPLAIWSCACAADTLEEMYRERKENGEYWDYIWREEPEIMLLSGGGNDLLGAPCDTCYGNIYYHLEQYQNGMGVDDLIKPSLHHLIVSIPNLMGAMLAELRADFPSVKVLVHGYDYSWPDGEKWLGLPFEARGVPENLHRPLIIRVLNLYNEAVEQAVNGNGGHYVDLRGTLTAKSEWYDELHPNKAGAKKVADKLRKVIAAL